MSFLTSEQSGCSPLFYPNWLLIGLCATGRSLLDRLGIVADADGCINWLGKLPTELLAQMLNYSIGISEEDDLQTI